MKKVRKMEEKYSFSNLPWCALPVWFIVHESNV